MKRKIVFLILIIAGGFLIILISTLVLIRLLGNPQPASTKQAGEDQSVIANFETAEWQGKGNIDQSHVLSGKYALKLESNGFDWNAYGFSAVNLNLTSFKDSNSKMVINVFVEDPSQISGIRLDLGDNINNFYFANEQTANFYQNGWNKVIFKASDFYIQNQPTGWQSISWARINLAAYNKSTVAAWFDDWEIIEPESSSPATSSASVTSTEKQINSTNNNQPLSKGVIMDNLLILSLGLLLIIIIAAWVIFSLWKLKKKSPTNEEESQAGLWNKKLSWPKIWLPIGIAIIIAVGVGYYFSLPPPSSVVISNSPTPETSQPKSNKWQYQILTFTIPDQTDEAIMTELNTYGDKDWEAVAQSTISTGKTGQYYLYVTLKKSL